MIKKKGASSPRKKMESVLDIGDSEDSEVAREIEEVKRTRNLLPTLDNISDWLSNYPEAGLNSGSNNQVCNQWKIVEEVFKCSYVDYKVCIIPLLCKGTGTVRAVHRLTVNKGKESRPRLLVNHNDVCNAAMRCITTVLAPVNQDLEAEQFSPETLKKFDASWAQLINELLDSVLQVDTTVACFMLDVIAEIGNGLYCRIPEPEQKRLIVFLLCYSDAEAEIPPSIKSKIGRCLGKMIEFPSLRDDVGFFTDMFSVIERNMSTGENVIRISFAWTFGNWSDALTEVYMDTDLELSSRGFVENLLRTAVKSTVVPQRGRYNACRACGNVYKWVKLHMLEDEQVRDYIKQITAALTGMIGSGMDYKLRWNAAHAVGHAFENPAFFQTMENEVLVPIIKTLAQWAAKSQNYKERTQCVFSLMKVKDRKVYGSQYCHLWERLCLSIARLPVEDNENVEKFKNEVLLMIFHLLGVLEPEDLETTNQVISENLELIKFLAMECAPGIPLERLDKAIIARDNLILVYRNAKHTSYGETVQTLIELMTELQEERDSDSSMPPE